MLDAVRPEGDQVVKKKTIESNVDALVATENYGKGMVVERKTRRNTKDTSSKERREKGESIISSFDLLAGLTEAGDTTINENQDGSEQSVSGLKELRKLSKTRLYL
ncbi:hypothetical protein GOBAR_DD28651 [Gossypium barbadense]|nr:hypothetical protein GOBAR_DD28651 [Gossypium barbadense]